MIDCAALPGAKAGESDVNTISVTVSSVSVGTVVMSEVDVVVAVVVADLSLSIDGGAGPTTRETLSVARIVVSPLSGVGAELGGGGDDAIISFSAFSNAVLAECTAHLSSPHIVKRLTVSLFVYLDGYEVTTRWGELVSLALVMMICM